MAPTVADGQVWRIVTSGFLHAGFLHIAINMFALFILGTLLEPGIGTPRFLAVYFVSLLAGSFGALLLDPNETTVGASGAIFGLMSAAFIIARHRGLEQLASQIGFYVIINLVFTFGVPGNQRRRPSRRPDRRWAGRAGDHLRRAPRLSPACVEVLGMVAIGAVSVAGALAAASAA